MSRKNDEDTKPLTYRDAGVDIDAGDELVERIKPHVRRTFRPEVIGDLGGFGGLFAVPRGYTDPVLVSGTDGVGTKLKVAFATGKHDTIGIDLVAMCVNDVAVSGAEPLFFLDYFASRQARRRRRRGRGQGHRRRLPAGRLRAHRRRDRRAAGHVRRRRVRSGRLRRRRRRARQDPRRQDASVPATWSSACASSGLHSNGYSLARKVLLDELDLTLADDAAWRRRASTCARFARRSPAGDVQGRWRTSPAAGSSRIRRACSPTGSSCGSTRRRGRSRRSSRRSRRRAWRARRCGARSTAASASSPWSPPSDADTVRAAFEQARASAPSSSATSRRAAGPARVEFA